MEERREKDMPFKLAWGADAWLASNHVVRTETLWKSKGAQNMGRGEDSPKT